jgi:hypothetical protein
MAKSKSVENSTAKRRKLSKNASEREKHESVKIGESCGEKMKTRKPKKSWRKYQPKSRKQADLGAQSKKSASAALRERRKKTGETKTDEKI